MPTQIDTFSYMNSVSANTLVDLYSFELLSGGVGTYGIKTKITFYDGDLLRLEAEHYVSPLCDWSYSPNYPGYDVFLFATPEGSTFTDLGYIQIWGYDIKPGSTPSNYYGHLQYPDEANIYNYFNFILKLEKVDTSNPNSNLKLTFSVNSPNLNGTLLTKSEILHAI